VGGHYCLVAYSTVCKLSERSRDGRVAQGHDGSGPWKGGVLPIGPESLASQKMFDMLQIILTCTNSYQKVPRSHLNVARGRGRTNQRPGVRSSNGQREKYGQFILRRVIEIVATICHILRLECTKFDFGWGSAPDPAGELTALPQNPSWI